MVDLKHKFVKTSSEDTFEIVDHMLYRDDTPVPFVPHDKRNGRSTIIPKWFVYHYHAGRENLQSLVSYLKKSSTRADVHLCMDRNGHVVQMAPFNEACWHVGSSSYGGLSGLNSHTIGIEVTNPGALEIIGNNTYKSWFGKIFKNDSSKGHIISEARHKHGGSMKGWLEYSPEQIQVLTSIYEAIHEEYGIDIIGHDDTTKRKSDPGPFSKINEIREKVKNGDRSDDTEIIEEPVIVIKEDEIPEGARFVKMLFKFINALISKGKENEKR